MATREQKKEMFKQKWCLRCDHWEDGRGTGWCYMFRDPFWLVLGGNVYCGQFREQRKSYAKETSSR